MSHISGCVCMMNGPPREIHQVPCLIYTIHVPIGQGARSRVATPTSNIRSWEGSPMSSMFRSLLHVSGSGWMGGYNFQCFLPSSWRMNTWTCRINIDCCRKYRQADDKNECRISIKLYIFNPSILYTHTSTSSWWGASPWDPEGVMYTLDPTRQLKYVSNIDNSFHNIS